MSKNRTVIVEVISAQNLMPKDGQGSASPFVEVDFDNQRFRTNAKHKSLNPVWNEKLVFCVSEPANVHNLHLDVNVYNEKSGGNHRNFLGKVRVPASSIAKQGEETLQRFPLDKRSIFSHIRGELSLKVYYVDEKPGGGGGGGGGKGGGKKENKKEESSSVGNSQQQQPGKGVAATQKGAEPKSIPVHAMATAASTFAAPVDFSLKETNPHLGSRDKSSSAYDLVEQMLYLYVRVVKARDLPAAKDPGTGCNFYSEVKLGNYKGTTKIVEKKNDPEWNQVFAFSKERLQASLLEVFVKDKAAGKDNIVGTVMFDLVEVPTRVPPDSPLAPQWYRLEDNKGETKVKGELMLSVWMGTQADEAFPEAWHSDAAAVNGEGVTNIKSKVYLSPKLWYVRVNVIEAQDLAIATDKARSGFLLELTVKLQLGSQFLRTRPAQGRSSSNPLWNEDLLFVAAEPFEEQLLLTVENRVGPNKDEVLGKATIALSLLERRFDQKPVNSKWFCLDKPNANDGDKKKEKEAGGKALSRIHLRACLDGGYHVLDESTLYSSDLRPTAKQLWKPLIGILEVGILSAQNLQPMKTKDGKGATDAYCVAKYGQKWVRTRTIIESFNPKWNEQYTWEVYDPCTVITVGVFDNLQLKGGTSDKPNNPNSPKDIKIGKVRIRLSTLETDRVYTHSYPLLMLHPSGVKKMGELQLAVRFSCSSFLNMMQVYVQPLLPKMHYLYPFTVTQLENLRYQAMNMVALRLSRAEPPLRREVVEYMLDVDSHMWSMRRSKANFFRITAVCSGIVHAGRWLDDICNWRNPFTTLLVHLVFLIFVWHPELILPTMFFYLFLLGVWNYRLRARNPPHMDARLSHADTVNLDELDEEFDTFPTSRGADLVRLRYDRLRSVAGRIQTLVGDLATQGERFQSLLSWRDPRASSMFASFCLIISVFLYMIPFQVVAAMIGIYMMRHPRFRARLPSASLNFFRRLPARTDSLI